jgi:L-threonylcarbamoyladenylate synthase
MLLLKATEDNISQAAKAVKNGELVVYPTDTVYGLGCDPFNTYAVEKLFKAKGERKNKPLPILASSLKAVERIAYIGENARKIAEKYWPGPLTLVVPKKPTLLNMVTCNLESVGVRIPNHRVALHLITLCDGLLVGTSANKTGEKPPKTAQEAAIQLGEEVDIILDDGPTPLGQESSIIDLTQKEPKILREGTIKLKHITNILTTKAIHRERKNKHGRQANHNLSKTAH